jgi:2,3-bisphosphoglycerate-independent phosphoglycerate mutase
MKKIILIVIDGLGDDSIPQLKNKTPLEAAKTPNLDFFAKNGICGLVLPWIEKGKLPTSEDTHLAIFGYDPKKSNPGRGVLEVLGIGEKIKKDDVCFRGNFATVDENLIIIDRRAGRIEKTQPLIETLNKIEKGKLIIKRAFGHRVGVILRGKGFSEKVSSNDPKKVGVKVLKIEALDKRAKKTAEFLNSFLDRAHQILENHPENIKRKNEGLLPANYLLLRGAGKLKKVEKFLKKYKIKAGFVAGGTLYKGIGRFLGMEEIKVKGATGLVSTNLKGKFLAARKNIKNFDFIFLHIKAVDNLAEDGNFLGKKEFIEKIDKEIKILSGLKDTLIVVTGDHSTSSLQKSHSKNPVPVLIYPFEGENIKKFSEKECKKGRLGKINQIQLLEKIIKISKLCQK